MTDTIIGGTNIIGKVGIDQTTPGTTDSVSVKSSTVAVTVSLTRTADVNAYAINDVIGAATGSTAALTFAAMGAAGKVIRITGSRLAIDVAAVPSGMTSFKLHLYSITPPSALGDNVAWDLPSGDRASYLGYIDLGTPVDVGSTLYVQQTGLDYDFVLTGSSLFGYLTTSTAYTPTSAGVKKITLYAMAM